MKAVQGKGGARSGLKRHAEHPDRPGRTLCGAQVRTVRGETRTFEDVPQVHQCGDCRRRADERSTDAR